MLDVETVPWDDDLLDPMVLGTSGPADGMFSVIPAVIGLAFAVVLVLVLVRLFQKGREVAANSAQPERTVSARVVGKRAQTHGGGDGPVTTSYHATFEMLDGERRELTVPHREYGLLVEGDRGQLTHQGSWFRGFARTPVPPLEDPWEAPGGPPLLPPPAAH